MSKKKPHPEIQVHSPLIQCRDMPACIVRPLLQLARQSTPEFEEELVRDVLTSMSLNIAEKNRVLTTDQLDGLQLAQLTLVFADERRSFNDIYPSEPREVISLQAKMIVEAFLLAASHGHALPPPIERALIARMVKRAVRRGLGLALYAIPAEWWSKHASPIAAVVWQHAYPEGHAARLRASQAEPDRIAAEI